MARRTYDRFCPLSLALEDVGDRWTLHIVYTLMAGPKRYVDLKAYLAGAGSNVLGDRLRRLADAGIVARSAGPRPGSETTYHLTERGLGLAPVIQGLVRWGLASLTMTGPTSDSLPGREVFDQAWAIPDPGLVADEAYQWTVDGVTFGLEVSGRSITRTRGPARRPAVTLATTSAVLDSVLSGGRTMAEAARAGDIKLRGRRDAVKRMFVAVGFPPQLVGL